MATNKVMGAAAGALVLLAGAEAMGAGGGEGVAVIEAIEVGGGAERFELRFRLQGEATPRAARVYFNDDRNSVVLRKARLARPELRVRGEDAALHAAVVEALDNQSVRVRLELEGDAEAFGRRGRCEVATGEVRCGAARAAFDAPSVVTRSAGAPALVPLAPTAAAAAPVADDGDTAALIDALFEEPAAGAAADTARTARAAQAGEARALEEAALPASMSGAAAPAADAPPGTAAGAGDPDAFGKAMARAGGFLLALVAAGLGLWALRRRRPGAFPARDTRPLRVVSQVSVGGRQSILLVEALNQPLLVASSDKGLQLLSRLAPAAGAAASADPNGAAEEGDAALEAAWQMEAAADRLEDLIAAGAGPALDELEPPAPRRPTLHPSALAAAPRAPAGSPPRSDGPRRRERTRQEDIVRMLRGV